MFDGTTGLEEKTGLVLYQRIVSAFVIYTNLISRSVTYTELSELYYTAAVYGMQQQHISTNN